MSLDAEISKRRSISKLTEIFLTEIQSKIDENIAKGSHASHNTRALCLATAPNTWRSLTPHLPTPTLPTSAGRSRRSIPAVLGEFERHSPRSVRLIDELCGALCCAQVEFDELLEV